MSSRTSARPAASRRDLIRLVRRSIARGDIPEESEDEAVEQLDTIVSRFGLTRRDLLKAGAATAGLSLVAIDAFAKTADAAQLLITPPTFTANALRRDDMLALRFEFFNLQLVKGNLVRQNALSPAYIVATLGYGADSAPQNIAEQAFLETAAALNNSDPSQHGQPATSGETLANPGTVQALLSGPTRLAFRVPDTTLTIPFALASLLDVAQLTMNVVPSALPPLPAGTKPSPVPPLRAPDNTETAIESPWHMTLSPHSGSTFAHAMTPVVRNGRTELWHTRLAVRKASAADPTRYVADETDTANRAVRAVWGNSFDPAVFPPDNDLPFRMSLKQLDRYQIIRLTSDFSLTTKAAPYYFEPKTIDVEKLMLSALGAWQSTRYFAEPPHDFNLGEWKHIATMGRDQYVKVVYVGWLMPFGHPAALIKVTERKIQPVPSSSDRGAYLRQRFFIVVRKPVLTYPDADPQPNHGRKFPYKTVEIKTTITPNLDDPEAPSWSFEGKGDFAFVPVVLGKPFQFAVKGTDRDGQTSEFTLALPFVSFPVGSLFTDADIAKVVADYEATTGCPNFTADLKKATLNGQKVGLAHSSQSEGKAGGKPGDTAVEIKTMTFGTAAPTATVVFGNAPFFPVWDKAEARLNGVEQVQGGSLGTPEIKPHPTFVTSGYDGSETFAQLTTPVSLSFTSPSMPAVDRAGGMVNPDMSIGGLSRKLGPVGGGDISTLPSQFDPATFFKDAKILGGIKLSDIVDTVAGFASDGQVPKLNTNTIFPNGDTSLPPQEIVVTFNFEPGLHADPLGIFDPTGAKMTLDATFTAPILPPGEPTYEIVGDLTNFAVTLLGTSAALITLTFNELKFTTKSGAKPDVDVDIRDVKFDGVLTFVNALKDYLKLGGGTGPSLEVLPTQVTAGFALPIPTIGIGVLTVQNISFGASITIPFTGKPARARFNFSEKDDTFLVTVMGLGGGGFFALALGLDGLETLEASIEVGASIALNLGIASGEVHALAGIYFKLERIEASGSTPEHDQASLTGYVRLGGSIDILGIASASVEFYLSLTYEFAPLNDLYGQASLTVEVSILCFSKSFSFSVERRIGGSDSASAAPAIAATAASGSHVASLADKRIGTSGLTFTDLMSEDEWDEYAAAFATS